MTTRPSFLALTPSDYTRLLAEWQEPAFRGAQLVDWLFKRRIFCPEDMSNLPASLRAKLRQELDWSLPQIASRLEGADASTKLLLKSPSGHYTEAVIMRYEGRTSLCVSSQVGCRLACSFCQTGKLGFVRHLAAEEILAQFAVADTLVRAEARRISHVVFMGMGEPLDNFDNAVAAVTQLTDSFQLSPRHVTLSTSGLAPRIRELAEKRVRASLAVSLHAARDDLRTELMPINRRHGLVELKEALLAYQRATQDKLTIEYILIRDKNCGIREAKELVRFLHGLRAKVNLIPFNAHPGMPYDRPLDEDIRAFQKYLAERSIAAPVRYSKGLDVSAACGQLAAKQLETLASRPERQRLVYAKPSRPLPGVRPQEHEVQLPR